MNPEYLIIVAGILSFIGMLVLQFISAVLRRRVRARRVFAQELRRRELRRALIVNSTTASTALEHEAKTAELEVV
jgi:hypothetical protein